MASSQRSVFAFLLTGAMAASPAASLTTSEIGVADADGASGGSFNSGSALTALRAGDALSGSAAFGGTVSDKRQG